MPDNSLETSPLLTTKLYRPPVTPDLEKRTRLIRYLERYRLRPLTLISAPAGYGKTILASQWLESCGCRGGWVSLDEFDNDLPTFVSYMLAAVRDIFPSIKLESQSLSQAPIEPSATVFARYLLNDLNQIKEPFILALDDIHRIQEPQIYEFLDELIFHPTHSLHLVLIGRHDPPLHIASLRARGQVTEIRSPDLRFTAQETAGLLSSMLDRQIDDTVAADWAQRTEGWVTALRLAALSLRHRGQAGNLHVNIEGNLLYLKEYLLAEVLSHMPDAKQAWLLKTAYLSRFCASLCEIVCRRDTDPTDLNGESFIDWLEHEDLFLVPLDDIGEWFRFHHLFQGLLQDMLQAQLSTLEIAALQSRASGWYAEKGLFDEAIQYALAAGDVKDAVNLVQQHRYQLMNNEEWHRLEHWLKLLPGEVVAQNPLLLSTKAFIAVFRGLDADIMSSIQIAEQLLTGYTPGTLEYDCARGEIDTIMAVWANIAGQPVRSMELAQSSLARLPHEALHIRAIAIAGLVIGMQMLGNPQQGATVIRDAFAEYDWPDGLQAKMMYYLCIAYLQEGDLSNVYTSARTGMWIMEKAPLPETLSFLRYSLGVVHYLQNDLAHAEPLLHDLLDDRVIAAPTYLAQGGFLLALIYQTQNRPAEALQIIDLLEAHFQETKDFLAHAYTEAFKVELLLRQGELEEAHRLKNNVNFYIRQPIWYFYTPQLTSIKLLLAENTPESLVEARTQLDVLDESMGAIHRNNVRINVLALLALVHAALGDISSAYNNLADALQLGALGGCIRSFVDLGEPMAVLLLHFKLQDKGHNQANYLDQILAAFPEEVLSTQFEQSPSSSVAILPKVLLAEPITHRELQILNLLAMDLTRQQIAAQLYISLGTLHVHTKNLYRKLGVHKRAAAIQVAKEIGII